MTHRSACEGWNHTVLRRRNRRCGFNPLEIVEQFVLADPADTGGEVVTGRGGIDTHTVHIVRTQGHIDNDSLSRLVGGLREGVQQRRDKPESRSPHGGERR